jgi:polyisoprenoid-binding protein YceI
MNPSPGGVALAPIPVAGRYHLDPARTTVRLQTRHLFGLGAVSGTVRLHEAAFVVADPATGGSVHAVLDAASFATGNPRRDAAVRSPRFLDVDRFPVMVFDGQDVREHDGHWVITGALTVRGVAAPVTLMLHELHSVSAGQVLVRATARIDRYAHQIAAAKGLAARWLTIEITGTAIKEDYR